VGKNGLHDGVNGGCYVAASTASTASTANSPSLVAVTKSVGVPCNGDAAAEEDSFGITTATAATAATAIADSASNCAQFLIG
jgi:hypothetical protein